MALNTTAPTHRARVLAVLVVVCLGAAGCSQTADTNQLAASDPDAASASETVPPTSVLRGAPTTTTTTTAPVNAALAGGLAGQVPTLQSLVQQFAATPGLLAQLQSLQGLDFEDLAELLGLDLSALTDLGLTIAQIEDLAASITTAPAGLQQGLATGSADPSALLGLLLGSVDLGSLTGGAGATLVQSLLGQIAGLQALVTPQLSGELGALLRLLDPDGLGQLTSDPANTALVALMSSVVVSENPVLTEQLLTNPMVDPALPPLVAQLRDLSNSIGEQAMAPLVAAIDQLYPGLIPRVDP